MTPSPRPLILVDVDGVLNVVTTAKERKRLCYHEGWRTVRADAGGLRYRLTLNPAHGPMLRKLAADTGAELAWGTTWEEYANLCVGPHVGLPKLPVCPVNGFPHKANGIVPWTQGHPFVWFDDEPDAPEVTAKLAGEQPHLVVQVDEGTGLTAGHVAEASAWLSALRPAA